MRTQALEPLAAGDAQMLVAELLAGEGVVVEPHSGVTEAIAASVDCNAFYIHHVVGAMKRRDGVAWTADAVGALVTEFLTAAHDPWDLRHFSDRVRNYYEADEWPLVFAMLDAIAAADSPMPFPALFEDLKSAAVIQDKEKEKILVLVELLQQDHYLVKDARGRYDFRFPLIKRWWRLHRGLVK